MNTRQVIFNIKVLYVTCLRRCLQVVFQISKQEIDNKQVAVNILVLCVTRLRCFAGGVSDW